MTISITFDNMTHSDFLFSRLFNDKIGKTRSDRTWIQENTLTNRKKKNVYVSMGAYVNNYIIIVTKTYYTITLNYYNIIVGTYYYVKVR